MNNNDKRSLSQILRLYFFVVCLVTCFSIAVITLINYQIVDVDKYVKLAETGNQIKQIVPAGRGEIVDRYGKKLATSSLELSLVINKEFPVPTSDDDENTIRQKYAEGNDIILKMIDVLDRNGIDWDEGMCIKRSMPCEFKSEKTNEVNKLKSILSQQKYATAEDSIALLIEKFNIYGYNDQQTRDIAIIRGMMLVKGFSYSDLFTLAEKIDPAFAGQITEMKNLVKGITISETSTRKYPCEDVGAHIVGNVGPIYAEEAEKYKSKNYVLSDFVGKSGIESKFEDELRGQNGILTIEKDKEGNTVSHYYMEGDEPQPGNNIRLSIDYELQKRLQEALGAYTRSHSNNRASSKGSGLVVLDVKTGEVLAAITYPYYNINDYNTKYNELKSQAINPLKNRAFVELYRPGSTWKTFMSAIGLYTNAINPSTIFNCSNPFLDTQMECLQTKHSGATSLHTALQWSCNNYFYNVAKILTIDRIDEFAPYFGFATDTGLELYNSDGRVTNPTYYREHGLPYYVGYTYQAGIGQAENYVTPLQMAISQLTIANQGKRYAAHVLKSIDKYDGSESIRETQPEVLSDLSDKNSVAWKTTIDGMKQMASTVSSLSNLDIATKSGSPQYSDANKALFNSAAVGIYPASNPEIAMGLIIEDGDSAPAFFSQLVSIYDELKHSRQQ